MSLSRPLTANEIQANFDELLAGPPADGSGFPRDTGLDAVTAEAVMRCWCNGSEAVADAARVELAAQLDGAHTREADEQMMRTFRDRRR